MAEYASYKDVQFSLKVTINRHKNKVLFVEAGADFADVLLSFLTLPLGTILKILKKHYGEDKSPVLGSLTTLYDGLANLSIDHFLTEIGKQMLLNPKSSFEAECRKLKLDVSDTQPTKYFSCENLKCEKTRRLNISMYDDTARCGCGKTLNREVDLEEESEAGGGGGGGGVFTIKGASFLISDDLRMVPNVAVSIIHTLTNLGITDIDGAELRTVIFGFNEIMDLLKGSLVSRTPLSDILLNQKQVEYFCATPKIEHGVFHETAKEATSDSKKLNLRLTVQKSTNKLLFAQSEVDFIDFLCSLLTIPLGGVECLLRSKTCLKNIDNMYLSIADLIDNKYLAAPDIKNKLMQPKLPSFYVSQNQILPLSKQISRELHLKRDVNNKEFLSYSSHGYYPIEYQRNRQGEYVKGPTMYMVTDDLTVTPLCMNSTLSILNGLKIPFYDIKEVEVHIGLEEALSILKASLTSTFALTDGLKINSMLMKHKQEY
ncbi:hypothetical protein ABFX02_13G016200 [Erythranthe guttata]